MVTDPSDPARLAALKPIKLHGQWPWSVLRADAAHWRERNKYWRAKFDDIAGREHVSVFPTGPQHSRISGSRSRFDPFLAELLVTWYTPAGGLILDPFAGGPTRGVVSTTLGRSYHGWDLSETQIEANRAAAAQNSVSPVWEVGDGITGLAEYDGQADAVLTCPPYHNLERYTTDPRDLSRMSWEEHLDAVHEAWRQIARVLADDRFAMWVTGDLRDPRTSEPRLLPERTIFAAVDAGLSIVNTHVLVKPVGTKFAFIRRPWESTRSAGRTHQMVIVAVKGDRKRATQEVMAHADRITETDEAGPEDMGDPGELRQGALLPPPLG